MGLIISDKIKERYEGDEEGLKSFIARLPFHENDQVVLFGAAKTEPVAGLLEEAKALGVVNWIVEDLGDKKWVVSDVEVDEDWSVSVRLHGLPRRYPSNYLEDARRPFYTCGYFVPDDSGLWFLEIEQGSDLELKDVPPRRVDLAHPVCAPAQGNLGWKKSSDAAFLMGDVGLINLENGNVAIYSGAWVADMSDEEKASCIARLETSRAPAPKI